MINLFYNCPIKTHSATNPNTTKTIPIKITNPPKTPNAGEEVTAIVTAPRKPTNSPTMKRIIVAAKVLSCALIYLIILLIFFPFFHYFIP